MTADPQDFIGDPERAARLRAIRAAEPPPTTPTTGEQHRGQLRLAERLVHREADGLRYVHGVGWHVWDGARWARDLSGTATRRAVATVKAGYADLPDLDRDARQDLLRDLAKCESSSGLDGMLKIAGSLLPLSVSVDQLDADPYLFNTASGTLDLRTGMVRPHDPADLLTKVAGCGYDPAARSETFDRFLAEILPDPTMRAFVARLFGHALVGRVIEHLLPILTGVGQNGKSTLLDVVSSAFGDYAIAAEPDLLVERGSVHTTGQADLLGVRLAVCSETDAGRRLAASTVKRLTGGDKVRARRMRQDNIEFAASHSVFMVTNHKPQVSGDDPALWRRLRIVPFDVKVASPDTGLPERLALELPAVLTWIVQGHRDWHAHGLGEPQQVLDATANYQAASDALGRFLDERCLVSAHAACRARPLFGAWSAWCHSAGEDPGNEVGFATALAGRGFEKSKRGGYMTYLGVSLLADEDEA
ncbi:MAG: phage/plasmid primase family C-domain protein [Frankiales bacterium]|nr:phage/plasmid primase family C-domain protein [Frankiales bacterium]